MITIYGRFLESGMLRIRGIWEVIHGSKCKRVSVGRWSAGPLLSRERLLMSWGWRRWREVGWIWIHVRADLFSPTWRLHCSPNLGPHPSIIYLILIRHGTRHSSPALSRLLLARELARPYVAGVQLFRWFFFETTRKSVSKSADVTPPLITEAHMPTAITLPKVPSYWGSWYSKLLPESASKLAEGDPGYQLPAILSKPEHQPAVKCHLTTRSKWYKRLFWRW